MMKFFFMALCNYLMKNWPQHIALLSVTKMQAMSPPSGPPSVQRGGTLVLQGGISVPTGGLFVPAGRGCFTTC
ncbi:MAG: hypothetical protein IAE84_13395 [Saprospiraceae bacterium]|nr:hypothetical protein [Saprospiraceae bacterium]HRD80806.1 hypothetical protein [Saprospiraceae bacterium]